MLETIVNYLVSSIVYVVFDTEKWYNILKDIYKERLNSNG